MGTLITGAEVEVELKWKPMVSEGCVVSREQETKIR
jgi:hypothetical protein